MLQQRLMRFRLRAKVVVEATALQVFAGWNGPAPAAAFPDPRLPAAGWRLLAERADCTSDAAAYDAHRLALGLPDGSRGPGGGADGAAGGRLRRAARGVVEQGLLHGPGN